MKHLGYLASCSSHVVENDKLWFQTTPPYGVYEAGGVITDENGKTVKDAKIVFDEEHVKAIFDAFKSRLAADENWTGVLVDQEHFSLDRNKPSTALAWALDIRIADDGSIWTRWEFTPKGEELWKTKELVNRSPVLDLERDTEDPTVFHAKELVSIAMTNVPHFSMLSTLAAARANHNEKGDIQMDKEILAALGLAETATKEEVVTAIQAMKDKTAAAEAKATAAEGAAEEAKKKENEANAKCRKIECDAFLEANKDRIADVAACREVYMQDPDLAAKMLAAYKKPDGSAAKPRIEARNAAIPKGGATTDEKQKIAARQKAVNDFCAAHPGATNTEAWAACRLADPELFAD